MFLKIVLPFTYFAQSRLKRSKDWIFHSSYEWIPNLMISLLFCQPILRLQNFMWMFLGYLAFISAYEIGYIFNDLVSTKYELNPRRRLKNYDPSWTEILALVLIKFFFFLSISYFLVIKFDNIKVWGALFIMLGIVYYAHNTMKYKPFKVLTFIQLAFVRILAPIILLLPHHKLPIVIISYFLCYILYRTLIYMESKNILELENRRSLKFTAGYYVILLPVLAFMSYYFSSIIPFSMGLYYIIIWFIIYKIGNEISK